jgi:signal transduction histidine kinase
VDGAIAFIQDVTERVAREEELRAAIARAELASQAKSEFLASMSHELRTPLSAVVGYADLLTMEIPGPILPAQLEQLERIKRCSWHLLDLVEEILTFARTEAGREVLDLADGDAREIARDALVLLEPQAAKKGLRVELALPDAPVPLHSDRTKVRQILVNLLGNAIKFTEKGTVSLTVDAAGDRVHFVVRDTGPGIPPEQTERIFEAFTQLDQSRTRVKGGTGLGLPVSRNLARLLGGDLLVESTPGAGSTFHVHIARRLAPVSPAAPLTLSGGTVALEARR